MQGIWGWVADGTVPLPLGDPRGETARCGGVGRGGSRQGPHHALSRWGGPCSPHILSRRPCPVGPAPSGPASGAHSGAGGSSCQSAVNYTLCKKVLTGAAGRERVMKRGESQRFRARGLGSGGDAPWWRHAGSPHPARLHNPISQARTLSPEPRIACLPGLGCRAVGTRPGRHVSLGSLVTRFSSPRCSLAICLPAG